MIMITSSLTLELSAYTLVHLPAVSKRSDFDDCHGLRFAFSAKRPYMFT
jgi:hypothetical protein